MKALLNRTAGIPLRYANRHGLITGQTGTGKSVSLMRLAEQFSMQGVPVFVSDVKGDLSALERSCPVAHLDLFNGLSVTVQAMGADLMARALELTDTQAGCLEIAFAYASDIGAPLDTLADLRIVLSAADNDSTVSARYGRVSSASVGVVMRSILRLESQGGKEFFRAPCFDVARLLDMRTKPRLSFEVNARFEYTQPDEFNGVVSILDSARLIQSPRVYSAFMLWLLTDLWNRLPEIGDIDKPRLVFFFDEAHLLFQDCPPALLRRIEQTTRLIRSKGVGLYFVSQRPDDIPEIVRSQLAHTIEHDRSLPVGTARFATMDMSGKPVPPATVRVELPTCPLGAIERQAEKSDIGIPVSLAAGQFDKAGYLFLACLAVMVALLACGLAWIWVSGKLATVAALAFGGLFAIRGKL